MKNKKGFTPPFLLGSISRGERAGFTLVELITVIIIIAILAALALPQYARVMERARGAEASEAIGHIRRMALAYYQEYGTIIDNATMTTQTNIPNACQSTHFFAYTVSGTAPTATILATRCTAGGKPPQSASADTIQLTTDLRGTTADTWTKTGPY